MVFVGCGWSAFVFDTVNRDVCVIDPLMHAAEEVNVEQKHRDRVRALLEAFLRCASSHWGNAKFVGLPWGAIYYGTYNNQRCHLKLNYTRYLF